MTALAARSVHFTVMRYPGLVSLSRVGIQQTHNDLSGCLQDMVVGPELAEQLRQLLMHVRNINVEDAPQCAELQHTDVQALSGFYKVRLCSAVAPAATYQALPSHNGPTGGH